MPYGVVLNASKAFAASVLPLLAKPVTTESKTMPITFFGVADITGAFLAGVVLSTDHRASVYIDKQVERYSRSWQSP